MSFRCSICGAAGHNMRTCREASLDSGSIQRIAELRQENDARAVEIAQYSAAIEVMRIRIDADRRVIADNAVAIHQLRERAS